MFKSNIYHTAKLILPTALRQTKIVAWIKPFISQVKRLMAIFTIYRNDTLFLIVHNSQVIYLEHYLNAKFNPDGNKHDPHYLGNGIYIINATPAPETFIFNTGENGTDTYLYNLVESGSDTYFYNAAEFAARIGFIIYVPTVFNISNLEIIGEVNRLRIAGKQFVIKKYVI